MVALVTESEGEKDAKKTRKKEKRRKGKEEKGTGRRSRTERKGSEGMTAVRKRYDLNSNNLWIYCDALIG